MLELPRGRIELHSDKPAINTSATPAEAAKVSDGYNTATFLKEVFFEDNPTIIHRTDLPSGGAVTTMNPSGPYSEGAVMVIAAGPHTFDQEHTKTETIYDYPIDTQQAYWASIIDALDIFNQHTLEEEQDPEKYVIFATENCMVTRTTEKIRTSRSIALPHSQVMRLNTEHIIPFADPKTAIIPHLAFEQAALKNKKRLTGIADRVQGLAFDHHSQPLQDVKIHSREPFGYSFAATKAGDVVEVAKNMRIHHESYTRAADELISGLKSSNQKKIIPQPSYRLYMAYDNGIFRAATSPEFLSHAGVMEAAGVTISRDVNHPRRLAVEKVQEIHGAVKLKHKERYTSTSYAAD